MSSLVVKMSDIKVAHSPLTLKTNSLGSCVGILLYDAEKKIGGMAHIMLPITPAGDNKAVGRYADKAIPSLLNSMSLLGANLKNTTAMLFGGADMFFYSKSAHSLKIGLRNVETCKEILNSYHIPIIHEDTGGKKGRSVELICSEGVVVLQDFNCQKRIIHF